MRKFLLLILLLSPLLPSTALATEKAPDEKQAIVAALDFLELADQGEYARCWQISSEIFQNKIVQDAWAEEMNHLRPHFGDNQQRLLQFSKPIEKSADTKMQPLLFLIFRSSFAKKKAVEMVTMTRDTDQRWRVAGYTLQ